MQQHQQQLAKQLLGAAPGLVHGVCLEAEFPTVWTWMFSWML